MFARRLFIGCLALVVLTRALHCLHVDATLCAAAAAARSATPPLCDPCESDPNESGCLCKGVVFAPPCLVADLEYRGKLLATATVGPRPAAAALALRPHPSLHDLLAPVLPSGRVLRALIASWQV
jgi:hypothetical protein